MKFLFKNALLFLFILLIGIIPGTLRSQSKLRDIKRPNIIFVLVDDMGWGDLGVFWQNQRMKQKNRSEPWHFTPSLDAMAKNGAMLTNHYCAAPVCAPSRASILLGVSQGHANVRNNQFDKALQDTYSIGSILQRAGYSTSLVGKWGLQGLGGVAPDWPAHPLNRGFDYSYAYIRHVDGHEHYPKEGIYRGKKEVWEDRVNVAAGLDKCFTTDLWTAKAKTLIIEKSRQKGKPFFLYLAYDVPHAVLELPTQAYPKGNGLKGGLQWLGKPGNMINTASGTPDSYVHPDYANATYDDDKNAVTPEVAWPDTYKRYATACRRIDDGIGDILQLLKDLEIDQNTLVVFTSDNGPSIESYLPDNVVPNHPTFFNSFGPFDGIKRDVWEGGVRMPTIVQWPGTVPANKVINQPSISYDWLPTFTDAANIAIPARIDGVSLIPELTGKGKQHESLVYIEYENNTKTPDFKEFAPNHRSRLRNQMQKIRLGDFVGVRYNIQSAADDFEIYNVVTDPQETRNLASSASFKTLQQQFKTKVLQVRRSDTSAIRPYDKAMVPGVSANKVSPGIKWMSFEGNFPWVARVSSLKPSGQGVLTKMDGINVQVKPGIFYLEGFIKIPSDGTYTFTMRGEGGFLLRIHDAMVIDGSYQYKNGEPISGSINLSEGYHPFRIYYHQKNLANPLVSIHWQANGGPFQPIPSKNLFH